MLERVKNRLSDRDLLEQPKSTMEARSRMSSSEDLSVSVISPTARANPWTIGSQEGSTCEGVVISMRPRHVRAASYEIQYPIDTDVRQVNIHKVDDDEEREKWLKFLEQQFLASTVDDGSSFQSCMDEAASRLTSESNSICGPRPLFAILPTFAFKVAMLIFASLHLSIGVENFLTTGYAKSYTSTTFHFEVVALRDPSHPVNAASIANLGVSIDSCDLHGASANTSASTLSLHFDRPAEMDGFFLSVADSDPALHPARLRVSYLDLSHPSQPERVITQPRFWTDWGEEYAFSDQWEIGQLPRGSSSSRRFRTGAPHAWTIGLGLESLIVFLGCATTLVLVLVGMYHLASRALGLALLCLLLQSFAVWILLLATEDWRLSWRWLRAWVVSGLLTLCVAVPSYEKALVPMFAMTSLCNMALLLADHALVRRSPGMLLRTQEMFVGLAMLAVGAVLAVLYSRRLKSVRLLVKQDKAAFDNTWKRILLATPADKFEELWRTVKIFSPSSARGARPVQQIRGSKNAWPVAAANLKPGLPVSTDEPDAPAERGSFNSRQHGRTLYNTDGTKERVEAGPVSSLDQLYAQAASASVLLRRKAQKAAQASDGAFPVTPRPAFRGTEGEAQRFMTLKDIQLAGMPLEDDDAALRGEEDLAGIGGGADEEGGLSVQWTDLKPPKRAIDKVLKQYHGEVHRLLDVCRETIVFEDFPAIASCIRALGSDREVVIERIKNSLDPALDASPTAGFRAVSINLRIVSKLSKWLCVDGHVCELLLTLRPLAQCMTHQSHQQYLQLRNFRVASRIPGLLSSLLPSGRWVGHAPLEPPVPLTSPRVPAARGATSAPDAPRAELKRLKASAPVGSAWLSGWDSASSGAGLGDFVARRMPVIGSLVPARWRRNRVHSEDDVELGGVGSGGGAVFGHPAAMVAGDSPFRLQRGGPGTLKFLGDDGGSWRAATRSGSAADPGADPAAAAGVFGEEERVRRTSMSRIDGSPPRLVRASTSGVSTDSGRPPPRVQRSSVSLIREESGQTEATSEREGIKWLAGEDLSAKDARREVLRWQYVRRALAPGGVLDRMRTRIEAAVAEVELFSVFETSYPIAAALCKRPVRYALLLAAGLYAAMVMVDTAALRSMGQVQGASFLRFRPTRLRGGASASETVPGVQAVGLMQDGCVLGNAPDASMQCVAGECVVDLGGRFDFNGFYFVTRDGSRAQDPVAFTLDAMGDDWPEAAEWKRVGSWKRMVTLGGGQEWLMRRSEGAWGGHGHGRASGLLASRRRGGAATGELDEEEAMPGIEERGRGAWRLRGLREEKEDGEYEAGPGMGAKPGGVMGDGAAGGVAVRVELRAPWHAWLGSWMLDLGAMITAVVLWALSKAGRPGWGRAVVVTGLIVVASCLAVNAGAETVARGADGAFPLQWANAGAMLAIGIGLVVREQLALFLWLYAAVHFIVMYAVEDWLVHVVWGEGRGAVRLASFPIASYVFVVVGLVFLWKRRQLRKNSDKGIAQDMARYREAWRQLCADAQERVALERVASLCANVWAVTQANGGAQQRCRLKESDTNPNHALRRSPSVGAAKLLDFISGWGSTARRSPLRDHRARRLSSMAFGTSNKPLAALDTHTPRTSLRSFAPRSPPTLGAPRSPPPASRDAELPLRSPETAITSPEAPMPSPEAPGSATSGTRVVMLSKVRRRSQEAAAAAQLPSPEERGGAWMEWMRVLVSGGHAPARDHRDSVHASDRTMSASLGSLTRTGSRWGWGSSRGSHGTSRSGSLRRGASDDSWLKTLRRGWSSGRKAPPAARLSRTGSWSLGGGGGGGPEGRMASTRRVSSLDQLYVQASGTYPLLKEKVKEWAWAAQGYLRMRRDKQAQRKNSSLHGGHFERWDQLAGDANLERMVRWATLKKRQRASEKLVRSYQGKVWKLLDICRQSIVFDSVADLADCLQLVLQDQSVLVCSVKNRLGLDYDDKETAGYRDVNINLCFQSEVAKQLGVENHICELQLLLRSFAELKTDDGHVRYVRFRNARAQ